VRLWRAYANATTEHVAMEKKLKNAGKQTWKAIRSLTVSVEAAAQVRELARHAIAHHEAAVHGKSKAAGTRNDAATRG
jgi:hypothetical protein